MRDQRFCPPGTPQDFHDKIKCDCQLIAEDAGLDQLVLVCSLPEPWMRIAFVRAGEEIEASLKNTTGKILMLASQEEHPVPPPVHASASDGFVDQAEQGMGDAPGWYFVGVIWGPRRNQIPEKDKEAVKNNFFGEVIAVLESYGLIEEPPVGGIN